MLTGEDNGIFSFSGGFNLAHSFVVNGFGLGDGAKFILKAGFDGVDVGLDPDERGIIAGFLEDFTDFVALGLGI